MAVKNLSQAVGRRKCAVARAYARTGKGKVIVNGKEAKEYFANDLAMALVNQPLTLTKTGSKYDYVVTVVGGGPMGQAGAVRLALARCIVETSPDERAVLKSERCLSRDSRMVERKKYGQKGARKRFQFSKR